ncbi:Nucleoside-diphosphate-sugar epimerase [Modicisalibacter muralis]|uniref:Nucleoside-diphosphate-sugar epimerase n=1 Tax=Modicisalibacter muralis TaxID=119000 RepID=A0A1G9LM92_9GAMM|nr:SDR family oxidoreductase [Halomonas muralis]SDL62964.1 Nucleoside-diphosphate-sugar epimerase [Halomonas muralis]
MSDSRKVALVVGASGIVGRAALAHFAAAQDWQVLAAARRPPADSANVRALSLDLLDAEDCRCRLAEHPEITHVFFTAHLKAASAAEEVGPNLEMLRNLVDALEAEVPGFQHINLMHGQKWYGNHLGTYRTPAKEDDSRHMPPNFYYDQQDFIVARQRGANWTWSSLRPQAPLVFSLGSPMNQLLVLAIYGSICKELGLPLHFPGSRGCYEALYQITDPQLLARSMEWVATQPQCANQAYNITNGDLFRWKNLWPRLAQFFGVEPGEVQTLSLERQMADKGPLWERIVHRHGLAEHPIDKLVDWRWGDFIFNSAYDNVSSTVKLRRSGFHDCRDSEECYLEALEQLRRERIIP